MPALIDIHQRVSAEAAELRRRLVGDFENWLRDLRIDQADAAGAQIDARFELTRREFARQFVRDVAPRLVDKVDPSALDEVREKLQEFEAIAPRPALPHKVHLYATPLHAGTLRTVLGTAAGAAGGLLLVALGPDLPVLLDIRNPHAAVILKGIVRLIAVTSGAALGAYLMIAPLRRIVGSLAGAAAVFTALNFLRGRNLFAIGTAVANVIVGIAGIILKLVNSPVATFLLLLLFVILTIATILLLRYTHSGIDSATREELRASARQGIARQMAADADMWSALTAGLLMQRIKKVVEPGDNEKKIIEAIVLRERVHESAERILVAIKSILGLTSVRAVKPEFVWNSAEHSKEWIPVTVVDDGDVVIVLNESITRDAPGAPAVVIQRGKVARKEF